MKHYTEDQWDVDHFKTLSILNSDPNKELIHNRQGRLYWVWKDDRLYVQRFARENGPYQARNLQFIRRLKPNARTIVDAGMNVGNNTMEYATWAQTVHGFEPFPETYQLAAANVELNQHVDLRGRYWDAKLVKMVRQPDHADGWFKLADGTFASLKMTADVITHNVGLGDSAGTMEMEHHPNNAGHNCMLTDERRDKTKYALHTVAVNTLDSYGLTDVDAIKIDCEGYELPILRGARTTIGSCRPVVQLEIVPAQCRHFGYTPDDIWQFFMQEIGGYGVYDFRGNRLPDTWQQIKGVMDRFFVPDELSSGIAVDQRVHPGMRNKIVKRSKKAAETQQ